MNEHPRNIDSVQNGQSSFFRYWGKAAENGQCHLLVYHSLDVAAVGVALANARPAWIESFASTSQILCTEVTRAIAFLLAMHDLGKFGDGFQNLRPDVARCLGRKPEALPNNPRHDSLGYQLWSELAEPTSGPRNGAVRLNLLHPDGTAPEDRLSKRALLPWIAAVTGHHGRPPELGAHAQANLRSHFGWNNENGSWTDALAFVKEVREILLPSPVARLRHAPPIGENIWKPSSWWLAGFATLCDWIGSNTDWFPYHSQPRDLCEYWKIALNSAELAVKSAGLGAPRIKSFVHFNRIFDKIRDPSPLQIQASEMPIGDGPQLFLLEDLTGSGKTEAALTLVARLCDKGAADGFYFALPTMATSNAMYTRVEAVMDCIFEADPPASLVLAHSGPRLNIRTSGIGAEALEKQQGSQYGVNEDTASALARNWLGDSRKKALLADAGVGTIDQALVGALQAKHNCLRLLGLHRHVLVVDEVHACDEYMNGILMNLLGLHAAGGGSAVLLSATLPIDTRKRLIDAFQNGLGSCKLTPVEGEAFPVLIRTCRLGTEVRAIGTRKGTERNIKISFIESRDDATTWCIERVKAGRCVAWIRNTVKDALEAFDSLVGKFGPDRVQLFHARFPMGDRLETEQDVVRRFGPGVGARDGRIVVSTQVMEQSLDVDFDEMISDIAPIDRLIQRAGRLHRHDRGHRDEPTLHVLAPKWEEKPENNWPGDAFKGTIAVYRRPSLLWRTQRVLREQGCLELPSKARLLVEAVYGLDDSTVPTSLMIDRHEIDGLAEELRNAAMAQHNKISLDQGYLRTAAAWADDEYMPTRLGDPTATLRLVRSSNGVLSPWSTAAGTSQSVLWRLGEVSVRTTMVCAGLPKNETDLRARLARLGAEPPTHVIPIEMRAVNSEWHGNGFAARGGKREVPVTIVFTPGRGLDFR